MEQSGVDTVLDLIAGGYLRVHHVLWWSVANGMAGFQWSLVGNPPIVGGSAQNGHKEAPSDPESQLGNRAGGASGPPIFNGSLKDNVNDIPLVSCDGIVCWCCCKGVVLVLVMGPTV